MSDLKPFENGFRTFHTFERSELRALKEKLDEETFLNAVAELLGRATKKAEHESDRANLAEGKLLEYQNDSEF